MRDEHGQHLSLVEYLAASPTLAGCRIYVKGSLLGRAEKKAPSEKPKKSKSRRLASLMVAVGCGCRRLA